MSGARRIAFIMDPLEGVKAYKDTTYYMMLAAHGLGHHVFYLDQTDLVYTKGSPHGKVTKVEVHADHAKPFTKLEPELVDMASMDLILVRTDPPFDRTYFYTTLLLDQLPPGTRVVNRPSGLRNYNEKLSALVFPQHTPETIVSRDADQIKAFMHEKGRITLKPIDGHGGRGIVFLKPGSENLDQLINMVTHDGAHWVIGQTYIPEAAQGDKRILLLNGEALGGVLRLHSEGQELNNLDAGGTANPTTLTETDLEICRAVGPKLVEQGIYFAGIDILGDKLIEINVTSPTCLQELCQFSGKDYHVQIIETLLTI